jgi:proteasome alpha subunit
MPIYASPEQFMRDRSEYARKGIARGRSVVVTRWSGGVLFVAENHTPTLHKVSEIYDRIGFAGVGRYNEFENLRTAGIRLADVRGFSYDRRDVTGRWLANAYAQTLGSIFAEHQKPFEVELCVAEVARPDGGDNSLFKISYDGSITDEGSFVVMGGVTEPVITSLRASYTEDWDLGAALRAATAALGTTGEGAPRTLRPDQVEVAILDRTKPGRTFRRVEGRALEALLTVVPEPDPEPVPEPEPAGDQSSNEDTDQPVETVELPDPLTEGESGSS